MGETYQEVVFLTFGGQMTKAQKRPNTEPQGVPEVLNRLFGKLLKFPRRWRGREELKLTKKRVLFGPSPPSPPSPYSINFALSPV